MRSKFFKIPLFLGKKRNLGGAGSAIERPHERGGQLRLTPIMHLQNLLKNWDVALIDPAT